MDMKLKPFDFADAVARAGLARDGMPVARAARPAAASGGADAVSFSDAMKTALKAVSSQQFETERLQKEFQLGNPAVSLEDTMIAMQKSQIGFQAAISVRNRFVQAYTEVMNMQV
ncbi:flagellar hook-basal body complex protein FliE [Ideonella sp.]|uniref:flagellar hook-basal body complex protein FliE n=1 Tax=Ideonella sp. TaxID=1929293 RepID=UPI0035AFAD77